MNSLVRAPVEEEALGPAKMEPPVKVIVGGRLVMGGRMWKGSPYRRGGGGARGMLSWNTQVNKEKKTKKFPK